MSDSARHLCSLAALLTLCGCSALRGPDPSVELLQAELRWMEDNLYQLDDQLDRCCEQLESARRNNAILRLELAEVKDSAKKPAASKSTQEGDRGKGDFDELSDEELYDLKSPVVVTGEADDQPRQPKSTPDDKQDGTDQLPDAKIRIEGLPDTESLPAPQVEPGDPANNPFEPDEVNGDPDRVTRIVLNRKLTGGYNFDRQSGHEGVMVVIEPQNAYAQYMPVPGEVTVEVRDPHRPGLGGRVGKWKFDAVESAAFLKQTAMGRGIHLQLPWPGAPPRNEHLVLTVAYETPDGRQLRSEKQITIRPTVSALVAQANEAERREWSPDRPVQTAASAKWRAER